MTVAGEYKRLRKQGFLARQAYYGAKTRVQFDNLKFQEVVRLQIIPDEFVDLDNLFGDCYNPDVNTDIKPEILEKQRQQEIDRINQDGVWGIVGEYFNGVEWVQTDSVWGFVGSDWQDSGYDSDIMAATVEAYHSHTFCITCHKPN